jgi:hypothetical protein
MMLSKVFLIKDDGVLFFDGAGVYEPTRSEGLTIWNRNDVNPWVGVQVNSVEHARKVAFVVYTDDELQEMTDEYADYMQDVDFYRHGGWN